MNFQKASSVKSSKKLGCISYALEILGDKWTPLLLSKLINKKKTFCALEDELQGISPRTLSSRLSKLEAEQIIVKSSYCDHPPRFHYELTKKGQDLQKVLIQMADWSKKHGKETEK